MKKMFSLFSIMILGILMMSFNILNDDEYEVSIYKNYISIANGTSNYSYYYDDADFYKLEQENDSYFYVIEFKNGMNVTILPSNNDYQLYGYIEDSYITFMNYLDSIDIDRLISNNEVEYISVDDDRYYELFNVLNEYLKLDYNIRKQTEITTFDFKHVASSQLEQITSTDEYVDNYVSNEYYEYVDKTDDDIVKIVPKDWFFSEGVHSYCGVEYYIYIETYKMEYEGIWIYRSEVFVADIDVTLPNETNCDILSNHQGGNIQTRSLTGIYVEPLISDIYIGIKTSDYNYVNHVDNYLDEVVLRGANYRSIFQTSGMPKYIVLNNLGAVSDFYDDNGGFPYIQEIRYQLDNFTLVDESPLGKLAFSSYIGTISGICDILGIPYVSNVLDTIDYFWNIISNALSNNEENSDYDVKKMDDVDFVNENAAFKINLSGENANSVFIHFYNFLSHLVDTNSDHYFYAIEIVNNYDNKPGFGLETESFRDEYIKLSFNLYDHNGAQLYSNITYENQIYGSYNYDKTNFEVLSANYNLGFNITNNIEQVEMIKSVSKQILLYRVPDDCYIKLVETNGRVVSSSISRHGHLKYIFMTLEAGKTYFLVGGTYSKNNKTFSITKETIGNLTYPNNMSYTYSISSNSSNNNLKCMSFNNSTYYGIYTINTSSYFDTQLYVYNEKGALLAFADDELYNSDDDPADYNASLYLPIGDYETIYIICTAINIYSSGQLTLSLSRWT